MRGIDEGHQERTGSTELLMFTTVIASLLLLLLAGGLLGWHVAVWRRAKREETDHAELAFRRRQVRRRVQTSGLVALLAVGLFVGQLIPARRYPSLFVFFWSGLVLVALWAVLLALADAWANRQRFLRLRREQLIEQAKLEHAARRADDQRGQQPQRGE